MSETDTITRRRMVKTVPWVVVSGKLPSLASAQTGGKTLFTSDAAGNTAKMVNPSDGTVKNSVDISGSGPFAVHPTEDIIYYNSGVTIIAADPKDGSELWTTTPEFADTTDYASYAISPLGDYLYTAEAESTGYIFKVNALDGSVVDRVSVPAASSHLTCSPSGDSLYVAAWTPSHVKYNTSDLSQEWSYSSQSDGQSVTVSPDGSIAYFIEENNDVVARNASDGSEIWRNGYSGGGSTDIIVGRNGEKLFGAWEGSSFGDPSILRGLDATDGTVLWLVEQGDQYGYGQMSVDPNNERLYAPNFNTNLKSFSTTDGTLVWEASFTADHTFIREVEPPEKGPQGIFALWDNFKAIMAAIIGAYALIAMWSRSLTLAAWAAFMSFIYLAMVTEAEPFHSIGYVTLVLIFVGFAFKLYREEMAGEG